MADAEVFRNRITGLEMVRASKLKEHPRNWRQHPEDQKSTLRGVLETVGIADAVVVYNADEDEKGVWTLIDGHLRSDIAGDQEVPCLTTDLDDEEAEAVLATHDVVTTMAVPDENEFASLVEDLSDILPREVLMVIDRDFQEGFDDEADAAKDGRDPKYPIVPQLDEGYDYVVVFSTRETDFAWLQTVLELPRKADKTRVGLSRVLTVSEFKDRWENRNGDG